MGLFDIFTRSRQAKEEKRSVVVGTEETILALRQPGVDFGVAVNNDSALKITAYYAGVRLIAENIAALPKRIYRDITDGRRESVSPDESAARAIGWSPNEYTNTFDFWFTMIAWLLNRGNAYALIARNEEGQIELHQIHPACVDVRIVNGHKWYRVKLRDNDSRTFLNGDWPDRQMLHFMQFTLNGIEGVNPVIYNAVALNKGAAIERFIADYFKKGGDKRAVLEMDSSLGDDAFEQFMKRYNATGNGGTPLLEYGIKFKQISVDPVSAALIESETFSVNDIARMLNIPPHMIAELTHATFSNIEHQTIQFVQYTLRPICKRIEVELERKLYKPGYNVKFILDGLLRGDTAARTAMYHGAILDGWMSRNEVRKMEGLQPAEGLDEYLYPVNEMVVGNEPTNTQDNG